MVFVQSAATMYTTYGAVCGGALSAFANVSVATSNGRFLYNEARGGVLIASGGAVQAVNFACVNFTSTEFRGNLVRGHMITLGGAVFLGDWGQARCVRCNYTDNLADTINTSTEGAAVAGGAISLLGFAAVDIIDSNFTSNTAAGTKGAGGALHASGRSIINVTTSRFLNNMAATGGGLQGLGSSWMITASNISNHSIPGIGAGLLFQGDSAVAISNCTITDNR
jgi:hypothetical protein